MSNLYIFPFTTCESIKTIGLIKQPYSAFINFINCIIIFNYLMKVRNIYQFLLIFSFLLFESFHTFSHMIHLSSNIY